RSPDQRCEEGKGIVPGSAGAESARWRIGDHPASGWGRRWPSAGSAGSGSLSRALLGDLASAASTCGPGDIRRPRLPPPKVGRLHLDPAWIRTEQGDGIVAPVFVLGACWGATELFIEALRRCLDAPQTAFLGCTDKADLAHAEIVFPLVLD